MLNILKLARPQFLVAGLALFIFGALVAVLLGSPFSWTRLLLGCLIVLPAQLSVNFGNDYFDVVSDQPEGGTFISGGSGILLEHLELRPTVKWIVTGLIVFSLSLGLIFQQLYHYSFWMMGFVILGNLVGWIYSAPPFRLVSRGLGELCLILVIGLLVPVMGYVTMRGTFDPAGALFLVPLLCYGLVFTLSVEIPDLEVDSQAAKRTWIVRTSRRVGFTLVGLALLAATGWFFLMPRWTSIPMDFRIAGGLSMLPLLPGLWGLLRRPADRQPATLIATATVLSLALFAILMDVYLWILI